MQQQIKGRKDINIFDPLVELTHESSSMLNDFRVLSRLAVSDKTAWKFWALLVKLMQKVKKFLGLPHMEKICSQVFSQLAQQYCFDKWSDHSCSFNLEIALQLDSVVQIDSDANRVNLHLICLAQCLP